MKNKLISLLTSAAVVALLIPSLEASNKRKREEDESGQPREVVARVSQDAACYFEGRFPQEIVLHIMSFLDVPSLAKFGATSKLLHGISEDEQLWKHVFFSVEASPGFNIDHADVISWRILSTTVS